MDSRSWLLLVLLLGFALSPLICATRAKAAVRSVYSAGFEAALFDPAYSLDSQGDWLVVGTGGTGLFTDGIFQGPSAFVGLFPPTNTNTETTAWYPVNLDPVGLGLPRVEFSVDFVIWDSTTNAPFADEFRWSVLNRAGEPLSELVFDTFSFQVLSQSGGNPVAVDTSKTFQTNAPYTLKLKLDFLGNRWSATLSNQLSKVTVALVSDIPLGAVGQTMDLGDIDATWVVSDSLNPGDNFMEFDNYSISAEGPGAFSLGLAAPPPGVAPRIRVTGEEGRSFAVEFSNDVQASALNSWTAFTTNRVVNGSFEVADPSATAVSSRFYRARWIP